MGLALRSSGGTVKKKLQKRKSSKTFLSTLAIFLIAEIILLRVCDHHKIKIIDDIRSLRTIFKPFGGSSLSHYQSTVHCGFNRRCLSKMRKHKCTHSKTNTQPHKKNRIKTERRPSARGEHRMSMNWSLVRSRGRRLQPLPLLCVPWLCNRKHYSLSFTSLFPLPEAEHSVTQGQWIYRLFRSAG